jgi:hypothetical protein
MQDRPLPQGTGRSALGGAACGLSWRGAHGDALGREQLWAAMPWRQHPEAGRGPVEPPPAPARRERETA